MSHDSPSCFSRPTMYFKKILNIENVLTILIKENLRKQFVCFQCKRAFKHFIAHIFSI